MDLHEPNDSAIRDGDPPLERRQNHIGNTQPTEECPKRPGDGLGQTALVCALLAWLGTLLACLAEFRSLHPILFVNLIVCPFVATIGGAHSAIAKRSRTGIIALILGGFHHLTVFGCIYLVRNGLLGPFWLD
jgi:hypothetical protein